MRRREILAGLGTVALPALARAQGWQPSLLLPEGTRSEARLAALPGKQELIRLTSRPPNYEAPIATFRDPITQADRFFVRYHLADIPDMAALSKPWSIRIGGAAAGSRVELTAAELQRAFPTVEIIAVNQCSGNRRGICSPHVPGVQWSYGAMGNAVWRGVRLKDVLSRAGVRANAVEVAFESADGPVMDATPRFRKSIPFAKAMDENVLLAFAINGKPLPHLNGFPLRLVVPGWTGTYWMKHLTAIEIRDKPLDSFWMRRAYRVPKGMFAVDEPFTSQADASTEPITDIVVNSLITSPADGARQPANGFAVEGIAWDRGHGIRTVEVSLDDGASWRTAELGRDFGRFAFRPWRFETGPLPAGSAVVSARAISIAGETQAMQYRPNPGGYHNNVPQRIAVMVG